VHHGEDATIRLAPEQPPEPLLEFQHRERHLVLHERVASGVLDPLDTRGDQRVVGDIERQLVHHDEGERVARNVDAVPERRRPEEQRVRGLLEAFDERGLASLALDDQRPAPLRLELRGGALHVGVGGEQGKPTALGHLGQAADLLGDTLDEARVARLGNILGQVQHRLFAPAERRLDNTGVRVVESQPAQKEIELVVHRERRRGQHAGVQPVEQLVAQRVRHIDRLRTQRNRTATAQLHPVDERGVIAFEDLLQRLAQLVDPSRQRIDRVRPALDALVLAQDLVERLAECGPLRLEIETAALRRRKGLAPLARCQTRADRIEEVLRRQSQARRTTAALGRSAVLGGVFLRVARDLLDGPGPRGRAEIHRRYLLEQVRLVKDHRVVVRQNRAERGAEREIGEEEVVVDHDQLRVLGTSLESGQPAGLELGAAGTRAGLRTRVDVPPQLELIRQFVDLGAIAGFRLLSPVGDHVHPLRLGEVGQQRLALELGQPGATEVVVAPLHHTGGHRNPRLPGEERDLVIPDLVLQVLGAGRDDHTASGGQRRDEVGQGLAGPRGCLDHQPSAVLERAVHAVGHLRLPGAEAVGGVSLFQPAAGGEERFVRPHGRGQVWAGRRDG